MQAPSPNARFDALLASLLDGNPVVPSDVRAAFEAMLSGAWSSVQIASYVVALRLRGETPEVVVAAANALRDAMVPVVHDLDVVVDTCGTGGDGAHTLNLSTAAAIVVAACGIPVAKHGNRSVSSKCGSADVLEALGVPLDVPPSRQASVLRDARIAFLFAPAHHGALKHAAAARRELGVRTIFNALGPLANPARATHHVVGVYSESLRPIAAHALGALGTSGAWVVRSADGLDEISPSGETFVSELLASGEVRERVVCPEDFGLSRLPREAIAGGNAVENARILTGIFDGDHHPARDAIVLNAAAALVVATGEAPQGCARAAIEALHSGKARATLDHWKAVASREAAAT